MTVRLPFRDINVHASTSHYAFTSPSSPSAPSLIIDRPTGDISLSDGNYLGGKRVSSIAGILGMIKLRLGRTIKHGTAFINFTNVDTDKYIIVITQAQPMGRLKDHMVYKVISTEFLPLRERPLHDADEDTYLSLLKLFIVSGPMYFSYSYDLTNSFQRQSQLDLSQPLWARADDRFFWNKFIQSDLIDFRTSGNRQAHGRQAGADPYILPVMFGMMEIVQTSINGTPLTVALITRRSRHRAGTRYFSRGIDEDGHVSNFNETEQIVILNENGKGLGGFGAGMPDEKIGPGEPQVCSYVQTRGSVPVSWAEVNTLHYTPTLQIRGVESAVGAAAKHFREQISLYGDNYLVNLVNQTGREKRMKDAYEQMVKLLVSSPSEAQSGDNLTNEKFHEVQPSRQRSEFDRLHYIYFDFHNETKGLQWHRAQLLLDNMEPGLVSQGYFRAVDMPGDQDGFDIRALQTSVVRTNCMDCLDRTNVVQSMLARYTLNRIFHDVGILPRHQTFKDDNAFELLFRNIWADNADVVSKSYSGTGALKTDFTRTGNRTKQGALQDLVNSITRYIKNNFLDGPKQDAFDLFLGQYLPEESRGGVFVDRRPAMIQGVPFILASCLFVLMVSFFSSSKGPVWVLRVALAAVAGWAGWFAKNNGMLYVSLRFSLPSLSARRDQRGSRNEAKRHGWVEMIDRQLLTKHRSTGQNSTRAPGRLRASASRPRN